MKMIARSRSFCVISLIALSSAWTSTFAQDISPLERVRQERQAKIEGARAAVQSIQVPETSTPQTLPFSQNWSNTGMITTADNWSGVPGIQGFRGDDLTTLTGVDPRTILADGSATPLNVIANQTNPDTLATGGVAEFDTLANPVVALNGSGTADAPHLVIYLNTTGLTNIQFAANIRDLDGSVDNSIQQVDVQYRVGGAGSYTSVSGGYIGDATTGPSLATMVTPLNLSLPSNANNQALVEVRVITTNAVGNDEWVGVDDISVTGTGAPPSSPARVFTNTLKGSSEVPPNASTATGYVRVYLNAAETQVTASAYYQGLSSGTNGGHIHGPAAVGVAGPIIFDLAPTGGQTSGSAVNRVFSVTPQQVADLKAGLWYINIHTTNFPDGEIRGQLLPATPPLDFDADGRTDFVVLRDSNGEGTPGGFIDWYISINATYSSRFAEWGLREQDELAFGDYDGDRKTDIAVFRRDPLATFYVMRSATNTIYTEQLGLGTDDPVVGDYDGNGTADTAVMRHNGNGTSSWYYRPNGGSMYVTLTLNSDNSRAGGDYDGDGKYDPAAFGDGGGGVGRFTILLSSTGTTSTINFGSSSNLVAPGDYDGDGKTDPCVIAEGATFFTWSFAPSTGGFPNLEGTAIADSWGLTASDLPAPGDYTGDGKYDYAIWRDDGAFGEFFVMTPVTRQIYRRPWGLHLDFPAAAANVSNGL